MKRAAELRSLSEDHHHGLVHARRLREAASAEAGNVAAAVAPIARAPTALEVTII